MPRTGRIVVENMPHHIVQRGHCRNAVFIEESDYCYYLETLKEWKEKLNVKVYSWCLMTNHVHLILDPGDSKHSIGKLMKRLAGRQTRYVNKKEKRTGSLWDGRYKMSLIDRDAYLLQCSRYVELNPVKAGIVEWAEEYRWSSYREKVGFEESGITDMDECYLAFDTPFADYKTFVESGIGREEQSFIRQRIERNQLTGGQRFVDEIAERVGRRIECRGPGRPRAGE